MSLQWYLTDTEASKKEHFAGTLTPDGSLEVPLRVWYNRSGVQDIADIVSPVLVLRFSSVEDSKLLQYCTVDIDDTNAMVPVINGNIGHVLMTKAFSGKANNGLAETLASRNNYKNITVKIKPNGGHIKDRDLKNLFLEIVPQ